MEEGEEGKRIKERWSHFYFEKEGWCYATIFCRRAKGCRSHGA